MYSVKNDAWEAEIAVKSESMPRYQRQTCLPEVGQAGQKCLTASRVLCVGAGGLGAPVLLYLAAAGVGVLGVCDGDRVDLSNLQRQILFSESEVGQNKAEAAARRLRALNSQVEIRAHSGFLRAENVLEIIGQYDIIVDGTDNFASKFLLNDAAARLGLPLVYGSISRFEGQVAVFWKGKGPCYRCLFPQPPRTHVANCAESGIIGGVAGMVGSAMAIEVIKTLLWKDLRQSDLQPLLGRLLIMHTDTMDVMRVEVPRRAGCAICESPSALIPLSDDFGRALNSCELSELLKSNRAMIVDVREPEEWDEGHIAGTRNWALSRMQEGEYPNLPQEHDVVVICQSGVRSRVALELLRGRGHQRLAHFPAGIRGWPGPLTTESPK